ncbi:uncharacterized protein CcaverHIS019_0203420 [Cutaneotrichosporon cavernicola]|uniref:Transcription initiation factor TFIID subunit 12 domain-containing protein n=1 Tax=Cutaneotrichosporon cavernicola TaxID=279322 RepID=A0AA48I8E1_9TREE|nr:uncharacterized protein CcaverHIS019_0203420 [Cutaneotrichosporon cavernicola]BEI88980.1 hypothetical protein CcaverHIS019_0203420 [Cutaneotrichosporon cavernicola]BEI96756.1 hypothetical protein CcaverHIS631_0203450 [Cutaneotrichosporon cavernicola]BEJ04528.1 hypothetical protein CcaverHIS641_0203450 [Cutaneotrichosporon cavernicola]
MSQPPSARPSPTGSPAVRPTPNINLENIYSNLAALIQRVRNNQLPQNQVSPLRSLISSYAKDIIIFHARLGRPSPLLNLPELLNPTIKVGNYEPLTTETVFLGSIQQGMQAARSIKPDQALIASVAARQRQPVRPPGTASPATSARASPQPQQPAMSLAEVKELVGLPTEERNRRLDADPAMKARFVSAYQFYQRRNTQQKQGPPGVRPPAAAGTSAAPSLTGTPSGSPAPLTATATPSLPSAPATPNLPPTAAARPPPAPPAAPAVPSVPTIPPPIPSHPKPASPAPGPAAAPSKPTPPPQASTPATPTLPPQPQQPATQPVQAPPPPPVIPQRPPSPPRPSPPPPEPEPVRRRRKVREYLCEFGPGLQVELGVDDVFGEVLDTFIESAARDAIRLAAHRSSLRVEPKDVALVLGKQHGIAVPGFAQQVPERVHVPEDSSKRARLVAPRAARRRDDE